MRKRWISLCLLLMVACTPLMARAEAADSQFVEPAQTVEPSSATGLILSGQVEARQTTSVTAPFGGTVRDFALAPGDYVTSGTALFTLDTIKVYAPLAGTVRGVFAEEGDAASYVQNRYGALCYIEQDDSLQVQTSLLTGFDRGEGQTIHIGQTVYLSTNNNKRTGTGRIIQQTPEAYTVELLTGKVEDGDAVNIYHNINLYEESRIGKGTVTTAGPIPISADGSILRVVVEDGQRVARGDVLFELVSGTLDGFEPASASVRAPATSVVASVSATAGQAVNKDQPLATLYRMDTLQLVCKISEVDLAQIQVGSAVQIVFDGLPGQTFDGRVRAISGIGTPTEDYAEYPVYVDFTATEDIRLGMNGTAYPVR